MQKLFLLFILLSLSFAKVTNEDLLKAINDNRSDIKVIQSNIVNIIKQMEMNRQYADKRFEDMNNRINDLLYIFVAVMSGFGVLLLWVANRNDKKIEQAMQNLEVAFKIQDEKVDYKLTEKTADLEAKLQQQREFIKQKTKTNLQQSDLDLSSQDDLAKQFKAMTAVLKTLAQNDQNIAKQLKANGLL